MVDKPQEAWVEQLKVAAEATAAGDLNRSVEALRVIAFELPPAVKRPRISTQRRAEIYTRDNFTCVYCGTHTIPECVLRALSAVPALKELFPWDANWRIPFTHPAILIISSSLDHVEAGSRLGKFLDDDENLVTACALCNYSKSGYFLEQLGWEKPHRRDSDWDGLTKFYRRIWSAAGKPDVAFHQDWLDAFESARE